MISLPLLIPNRISEHKRLKSAKLVLVMLFLGLNLPCFITTNCHITFYRWWMWSLCPGPREWRPVLQELPRNLPQQLLVWMADPCTHWPHHRPQVWRPEHGEEGLRVRLFKGSKRIIWRGKWWAVSIIYAMMLTWCCFLSHYLVVSQWSLDPVSGSNKNHMFSVATDGTASCVLMSSFFLIVHQGFLVWLMESMMN